MEIEIENSEPLSHSNLKVNAVPVLNTTLSYNEFFQNYMWKNVPCIIQNIAEKWPSFTTWVIGNQPQINYLRDKYGNCDVTIYNCTEKYFNSHQTETLKFKQFLEDWGKPQNSLKYLKDWHLKNTFSDDNFYTTPKYFASDWLNEYLVETNQDDYRFVYMGQKGTWTPFHADVYGSYSWSVNVCGQKRWILFPPGEEDYLKDSLNNLIFDISECYQNRIHFELIQNQGEAIFVPSGWYHQVWNLEDTISINHNWINGCNINHVWHCLYNNLNLVKKEIENCQDMDNFLEHCQLMLKASFGMNFYQFYDFLYFIATKRLLMLNDRPTKVFHDYKFGKKHVLFDLKTIEIVVKQFIEHSDISQLLLDKKLKLLLEEVVRGLKK